MTIRRITLLILIVLAGSATALFAAGAAEQAVDTPAQVTTRSTQGQDINTLDPAFYRGNEEYNIDLVLYSKLIQFEEASSDVFLDAAESVDVSDDGTEIAFRLREGIQFHRGYGEMTAEDVKFSFERIADPETESAYQGEWQALDRVEVTGRYTGVIYLTEPFAPLFVGVIPFTSGSIVSQAAVEDLGDEFATNPVGSGPYQFVEWVPGQRIVLERFDDFYGDLPDFERIVIRSITELQTAELALEQGELDVTEISIGSYDRFDNDPRFEVLQVPVTRYIFLGFNHEHEPFNNRLVREAVRYAVNVPDILTGAYRDMISRANSMIAPGILGHWEDAPQYDVDLDRARELLAEAGYPNGFTTQLTTAVSPPKPDVAQIVQSQLAEIGIDVEIQLEENLFPALGAQSTPGIFLSNYGPSIEPDRWAIWWTSEMVGSWNFKKFSNAEYDELRDEALVTTDSQERAALYVRMQEILDEEISAVWISNGALLMAHSQRVRPAFLTQRHQYRFWEWVEE